MQESLKLQNIDIEILNECLESLQSIETREQFILLVVTNKTSFYWDFPMT